MFLIAFYNYMYMNIAIILASGNGTRINKSKIPKQFIKIDKLPVLLYGLKTFYFLNEIDKIVLTCKKEYKNALLSLLSSLKMDDKVIVVEGSDSRNKSLANAVKYIKNHLNPSADDIILSHDGVRIFVTKKIILENIKLLKANTSDVIYTAIKSPDTLGEVINETEVSKIFIRDLCFRGQTPQSAKWKIFDEVYQNHFEQNLFDNSDFCKLALMLNKKITLCNGSELNFKITTDYDLLIAKKILESN